MLGFFKGFIEAVKQSNRGFTCGFDTGDSFDEQTLKGKLFGGIFGREQYEGNGGSLKWSTKCQMARDVSVIRSGEFKIPEDKLLDKPSSTRPVQQSVDVFADFEEIGEDSGLPF